MDIKRTFKYFWLKFLRLRGNPQSLAWGTAIGVLVGISPTMPLHTVSILFLTFVSRTSTIAALTSSVMVCNPLTYVPIYYFSLVIGNAVTPYEISWQKMKSVLDILLSGQSFSTSLHAVFSLGYEACVVMVIGGLVLALPFTILSYFLSLKLFITIHKKRRNKHILD